MAATTKTASGNNSDTAFAKSFSNLAHAYLRDKAPTLIDYEQGFQMLDKDDDNEKAFGVIGFRVGSQKLAGPVFFLKGKLKGHELLYLPEQDMFVPLNEGWLRHIINRRPQIIGTGVNKDRLRGSFGQPDVNKLRFPQAKYAEFAQDLLPVVGHLATRSLAAEVQELATHCQERLDLGHFLKQASLPALRVLADVLQRKPKIASAFDRWHGLSSLADAVSESRSRLSTRSLLDNPAAVIRNQNPATGSLLDVYQKQAAVEIRGQVTIIMAEEARQEGLPEGLSDADAEKLLQDGVLVKDDRDDDNASVALRFETEQRLHNPHETGVYDVLVSPGRFDRCLVIVTPESPGRNSADFCTVVRLGDSKTWGNFRLRNIFVTTPEEETNADWEKWFESQTSATPKAGGRYVIIGPKREATAPFVVHQRRGEGLFDVWFQTLPYAATQSPPNYAISSDERDGERICLGQPAGSAMRIQQGDVFIPEDFKLIETEPAKAAGGACCSPCNPCAAGGDSSVTEPIRPGSLPELTMGLLGKTAALQVDSSGFGSYSINGNKVRTKEAALASLVGWAGLREKQARYLLEAADTFFRKKERAPEYRVKVANPYQEAGARAPAFPDFPEGGYNPMGYQGRVDPALAQETVVPDTMAANTDPAVYDQNPQTGANVTADYSANFRGSSAAADSSQQELFDMSTIGGLLRAVRDDTLIDRYLPDLVRGMDRLGRLLFMLYWHGDRFEDRYGKQDLPALEDALRNAFEMVGETVLFLQQKTVEPYPEEGVVGVGIDRVASV